MYLSENAFRGNLISVLELSWEQQDLQSGDRPFHALSFRIQGNSRLITKTQEVSAGTGDILLVPADYPYRQISAKESLIVIHFSCDTPLPPKIIKFVPKDAAYYEGTFRDLLSAWNKRGPGYQYECASIFHRILFKIEQEAGTGEDDPLTEIMDYISDHFTDRDFTLEELARKNGMSGAYLRRLFSARFGISPMRYVQQSRLRLAKALLQTDYYSIEEVAEACGFANVYYFSNFIKKETGVSPSSLRAK